MDWVLPLLQELQHVSRHTFNRHTFNNTLPLLH